MPRKQLSANRIRSQVLGVLGGFYREEACLGGWMYQGSFKGNYGSEPWHLSLGGVENRRIELGKAEACQTMDFKRKAFNLVKN